MRTNQEIIDLLTDRAEKAEAELAEFREAVAGYFKCLDWRDNCTLSTSNSHKQKLVREAKHAEQQLRELVLDNHTSKI